MSAKKEKCKSGINLMSAEKVKQEYGINLVPLGGKEWKEIENKTEFGCSVQMRLSAE